MQRKYLISRQDVLCISRYSSPENIIKSYLCLIQPLSPSLSLIPKENFLKRQY